MQRAKQFSFFKPRSKEFGGSMLKSKRKEKRPLSVNNPIHLVIKSEKARGELSFINHRSKIEKVIALTSKKFGIKVHDFAINFNHIHFVISFKSIASYTSWIRQVTARIVYLLAMAAKQTLTNFFTWRPYTRILTWGRNLSSTLNYLVLNKLEVVGMRPQKFKKSKARNLGAD